MTGRASCAYCASRDTRLRYAKAYHKIDKSFGPFDLLECCACGSLSTLNPPSQERLADFYRHYEQHRPDWYVSAAASSALSAQYRFYAKFVARHLPANPAARWIDVGAGHGEVANNLMQLAPAASGCAVDIASDAPRLSPRVNYVQQDINQAEWIESLGSQFDLVYSVAVWEHVVSPLLFARESLSLVADGGTLVMICPDYGSLARRALGQAWPYFEPGEHLSIPTARGAEMCVSRAIKDLGMSPDGVSVKSSSLWVGYSLRYVLDVLRLGRLAKMLPPNLAAPLPTGILATVVRRRV